jgi:Ran GTPase-activating protein (RanGAP) involved in mRNA processing and transport
MMDNDNDHGDELGGGGIIYAEDYFYNEEELSDEDDSSGDDDDSSDDDEDDVGDIIDAEGYDSDEDEDELSLLRRDERIRMITQNDPCLTYVDLMECAWYGHGGEFGASIGRNNHLTKFWIRFRARPGLQFFRRFAFNRSIETLIIGGLEERIVLSLIPFFQNNHVLRRLELLFSFYEDTSSLDTWASVIRQFNTLEEFDLTCCKPDITGCKELIEALACHDGLKKIAYQDISIGRDGFEALAALLRNPLSKLKELVLKKTHPGDELIVVDDKEASVLSSGLTVNKSLSDLTLSGNHIGQRGWQSLFDILKSTNCRLENLDIQASSLDDSLAIYLANALQTNSTIKRFRLIDSSNITNTTWQQLFALLLQRQNSTLECLCLSKCLNDGTIQLLASTLAINSRLIELNLSSIGDSVTDAGWDALFIVLCSSTSALKKLDLSSNTITDTSIEYLVDKLAKNKSLKELELNGSYSVTTVGWQTFSTILQCQTSVLEKIGLSDNDINDQVLVSLTNALASNTTLRELNLPNYYSAYNNSITSLTSRGLQTFSAVFENPIIALERLDFAAEYSDSVVVDDSIICSFANALINNNKLRELIFHSTSFVNVGGQNDYRSILYNSISSVGYNAISRTLCNPSTILDTFHSNHTLSKFGDDHNFLLLPSYLRSLLRYNREESKCKVARMKIIKTHFSGSDIKTQVKVFTDMESNVLPTAIAWIVQDDGQHRLDDLLFALLRNAPHLYDTKCTNKKRKASS